MKSIYKYLVAGSVLLGGAACEDKLDLAPYDAAAFEDAFQTQSDFTNAIRGTYSGLRSVSYYGGWMFSMPDIMSDNVILSSEGRQSKQNYYYWQYNGNITWGGLWAQGYDVVFRANQILNNIEKLPEGEFRDNIRAEALALRAMAHFDMARVFAESPAVATGSEMGIPYVTEVDIFAQPSRPALSDTYTNILGDLTTARDLINSTNELGRLNKTGVNALLTRVYLFMGDYQNTITSATAAIDGGASVASLTDFSDVWTDESDAGIVFQVPIVDQDDVDLGVEWSQTSPEDGVRSEYVVDYDFYLQFESNDVRTDAYISTSPFAGKAFNHIAKYFGRPTGNANVVDLKILRGAEVYLSRAEAYAALGQDGLALADLNEVRENRYADFVSLDETGADLEDAIAHERRLELAFEGDRFFTLKRKGLPIDRSQYGDEADGSGVTVPESAEFMPADSYLFLMPIPQSELNANPNMTQNPGYAAN